MEILNKKISHPWKKKMATYGCCCWAPGIVKDFSHARYVDHGLFTRITKFHHYSVMVITMNGRRNTRVDDKRKPTCSQRADDATVQVK